MANPGRIASPKNSDFSREIQQKRIDKELVLLDSFPSSYRISRRESPFGVIVTVDLSRQLLVDTGVRANSVAFEVHLEGKFPFTPPVITCLTHFTDPTIADGRDLLPHLIASPWSPSYTVSSLITELPTLVKTLNTKGPRCALELCSFSQDTPLSLKTWDGHPNMSIFPGKELEGGQELPRVFIITETVLLTLEPYQQFLGVARLVSWGKLLSLGTIRRTRLNPSKLTLEWKASTEEATQQVISLKDASRFVEFLASNIEKLQKIDSLSPPKTLAEDEVTQKALRKVHINDILQAIAVYEANFEEKLNAELINSLLGLYQQAIEYFSGMGDPRYDEFLDRMHCVLSNEEVLTVLRSGGEEDKTQNQKPKEHKKPIREEVKRMDGRSPLRKEIEDDLVLETPLIETLTLPPAAKASEAIPVDPSSTQSSEPLFPEAPIVPSPPSTQ